MGILSSPTLLMTHLASCLTLTERACSQAQRNTFTSIWPAKYFILYWHLILTGAARQQLFSEICRRSIHLSIYLPVYVCSQIFAAANSAAAAGRTVVAWRIVYGNCLFSNFAGDLLLSVQCSAWHWTDTKSLECMPVCLSVRNTYRPR